MRPNLRRWQFQFRIRALACHPNHRSNALFAAYLFAIGSCGRAGRTTKLEMLQIDQIRSILIRREYGGGRLCIYVSNQRRSSAAGGGDKLCLNQSRFGDTKPSMRRDLFLRNVEMDGKTQ